MKPLNWVELTRQQIKARNGFGWSIQGIEKQNKVVTKIVYRFSTGARTTVLTDIEWNTNNSKRYSKINLDPFYYLVNTSGKSIEGSCINISNLITSPNI